MADNAPVRVSHLSLIEVLQAAHLTYAVHSPFPARSGVLLVKPAGHLGTSFLTVLSDYFPNFLLVSDLNQNQLSAMRDDLFGGRYQTVAFADMIKLYERNQTVAANLEGTLRSMVDEGWAGATSKDHRVAAAPVRVHIMGAMTPSMYENKFPHWLQTGFARRFLWVHFMLAEPAVIGDAIQQQQRLILTADNFPSPPRSSIPCELPEAHKRELRMMLKKQPGYDSTPFSLLIKIASVLKWKYERMKAKEGDYMRPMRDFGKLLQHKYTEITIQQ